MRSIYLQSFMLIPLVVSKLCPGQEKGTDGRMDKAATICSPEIFSGSIKISMIFDAFFPKPRWFRTCNYSLLTKPFWTCFFITILCFLCPSAISSDSYSNFILYGNQNTTFLYLFLVFLLLAISI
jgi:hypothetical protein